MKHADGRFPSTILPDLRFPDYKSMNAGILFLPETRIQSQGIDPNQKMRLLLLTGSRRCSSSVVVVARHRCMEAYL